MALDVWELALGFMDSQVLLTAEEIGVFNFLDREPRSARQVADARGLPLDSTERLLTALCALGVVEKREDGRFANGPEVSEKLVRGKPGYIGSMFQHVRDELYPVWGHLKDALYEGRSQAEKVFPGKATPTEDHYENPEALRAFMEGMHAITYHSAVELAKKAPDLGEVETLVDVGGASGAFLIALAQEHPGLRGIVFDLPAVQPITEGFLRDSGLSDRLRFQAGDFWAEPLPAADAYSLGFILHDWDETGGSILLRKVAEACRPGGLLVLGEFLLNDDRTGPLFVARQNLNMLVAARGRERSLSEYREWLGRFGFEIQKIHHTPGGKHYMLARFTEPGKVRASAEETPVSVKA